MRVAVIGTGSIGKRHLANLASLRHEVAPADIGDPLPFDVQAAIICTPTELHIPLAQKYADHGIPTLIEKPLSHSTEGLDHLLATAHPSTMVACNLRFHQAAQEAVHFAHRGRVLWARAEFGFWLPFWRGREDYRKSYSAGDAGGIVLDAIHEPDLLMCMFGTPLEISMVTHRSGRLEISQEDSAEISMRFNDGVTASVHIDYLSKSYHRQVTIATDRSTATFQLPAGNEMYVNELRHFLTAVEGGRTPMNSLKEAIGLLTRILDAKAKSRCDHTSARDVHPLPA